MTPVRLSRSHFWKAKTASCIQFEDLRKTYVKREDVHRYLEARTFQKDQVAA
jgi:hypothetical protein